MFGATFFVEYETDSNVEHETDSNVEHGLINNYMSEHNKENQENATNSEEESEEFEQAQYIVFGYYRNINISNNYIIPLDIINLSLSYYHLHIHHIKISYNDEGITFDVKPNDTIWDIKTKIVEIKEFDIDMIKYLILTYNDKELKYEANTLLDYNIKDGSIIKISQFEYIDIKITSHGYVDDYSYDYKRVNPRYNINDYSYSYYNKQTYKYHEFHYSYKWKVYKILNSDQSDWWSNKVELFRDKTFLEQDIKYGDTLYFDN